MHVLVTTTEETHDWRKRFTEHPETIAGDISTAFIEFLLHVHPADRPYPSDEVALSCRRAYDIGRRETNYLGTYMLRVSSIQDLNGLRTKYPVLVRSTRYADAMEQVVENDAALTAAVTECLRFSDHACIFTLPTTLGGLLQALSADTAIFSGMREREEHPNVKKILAYGDVAVRYLLLKIAAGEAHWEYFSLLRKLTGANPMLPAHAGRFDAICADWLQWARQCDKLDRLAIALAEPLQDS